MKKSRSAIDSPQKELEATYVVGRPPGPGLVGYTFIVNTARESTLEGLFVPRHVSDQILEEQFRKEAAKQEEESRSEPDEETAAPRSLSSTNQVGRTLAAPAVSSIARLLVHQDDHPVPERHFRVWQPSAVRERVARHDARSTADRELRTRDETLLTQLIQLGPYRPLLQLPKVEPALRLLAADFPGFLPVIEFVAGGLASGRRIPPILLVGPPGIGKTFFAHRLAQALTMPLEIVNVASGANSSSLCGVGRNWSNSEVGALARLLLLKPGAYANSMLLVDEVDKEPETRHNYPVTTALLDLLEQESARRFRDQSLELAFDTSMLTWIATANSVETIPPPLLSRLLLFVPRPPDAAQMLARTIRIAQEVAMEFNLEPIPRQAVAELADRTPRAVRQALQAAATRTRHAGRRTMTIADIAELSSRSGNGTHKQPVH